MTVVNTATGEIIEPLTDDEAARLRVKEHAIERGADQVAQALATIRDERLYRADYPTFEAYCRERWGMTHRHVNRQIVAAEVAEALGPIGPVPEGQARELADLRDDPERLREVYAQAQEATGGNVTAKAIRDIRNPAPEPEPTFVSATEALDGKTYSRPASAPRSAPRRALPDQFFDAAYDATKKVESLHRLIGDDRFPQNAEKVAAKHRNDLLRTRDLLEQVINALPEKESTP